ncbi:dipeptide epimerase [Synechococcus sp. RC10A2]|jgi:muconate cycloisomerase|uniref:dipeptide epimerase n=1 Tax=Synechococcus sp. RC10A2 TaxID=2964529 RepID=UPI0039C6525E
MQLAWATFTVNKRFPLTISRGTTAQTVNVWARIEADGIEGWGEASPFGIGDFRQSTEQILEHLARARPLLEPLHPLERARVEQTLREAGIGSAARAAIDLALWDWLGKRTGLALWQMLGLSREAVAPTSVTIGINPPEVAQQRTRDWLELTHARALKIKLGNPAGIEADQAMFEAIRQVAPQGVALRVDANGGWSLQDALTMCRWLAARGVEYVEQPLPRGAEDDLPHLHRESPLPIFVDESCFDSHDVARLADRVHGVNIKLMKCGGLSEALRMVHTARALGLQVMYGCYSDSSLAITAASQIAPLADHLDLDSHLNLLDDPFIGAELHDGKVIPTRAPGLGVRLRTML